MNRGCITDDAVCGKGYQIPAAAGLKHGHGIGFASERQISVCAVRPAEDHQHGKESSGHAVPDLGLITYCKICALFAFQQKNAGDQ